MAKYGKFSNVTSYLVMAGKPSPTLEETIGYYGEELVIMAQMMGVNSYAKVDLDIAKYHFEIVLEEAGRIADTTYEFK